MAYNEREQLAQKRQQEKMAALIEADINAAASMLLNDAKGRRFLWWLLQIGRYGTQTFHPDPYRHAFSAGELNVGQQILDRIVSVDPAAFIKMQQEHLNEHTNPPVETPADGE